MSEHEPWCEGGHIGPSSMGVTCEAATRMRWISRHRMDTCPQGRNGYHTFDMPGAPDLNAPCRYGCGAVFGDLVHPGLRAWGEEITVSEMYYEESREEDGDG